MPPFFVDFYIFIMAAVLAIIEIQIEGKDGWAKNLPTWRPDKKSRFSKFYSWLMSGKEVTGYHLAIGLFVILIFHLPFVFGLALNLENWLKIISLIFIYNVVWDFLWFVFNPYFTISRFNKQNISWHTHWVGPVPRDYTNALIASFAVLIPLIYMGKDVIQWWLFNIAAFSILTILAIIASKFIVSKK